MPLQNLNSHQIAIDSLDISYLMLARLPKSASGALMGIRESYLNAACEEMIAQSGSIDAFTREELGVSEAQPGQLKANLLY
ncbi:tyrosine-protein phosphatase [Alteromonas gilva]|uniref:Tyrosine-protein phosphatase n=1 Tax=Alteromonas gilva TaxID=2987522 RepID=A0ABT5L2H8_9ALTE|nr:tyrosine-protein phosphatase [Alteromonas gilva]MDC8830681.1 tyrosine-protein phosphatase [Alteromonas gilva]